MNTYISDANSWWSNHAMYDHVSKGFLASVKKWKERKRFKLVKGTRLQSVLWWFIDNIPRHHWLRSLILDAVNQLDLSSRPQGCCHGKTVPCNFSASLNLAWLWNTWANDLQTGFHEFKGGIICISGFSKTSNVHTIFRVTGKFGVKKLHFSILNTSTER